MSSEYTFKNPKIATDKELAHNFKFDRKEARPDINILLSKMRDKKDKEKKENYIFLGLVCSAVAVTGIIASL
ncbi:hypothetical protein N9T65_00295 [Candidatus Pelagibacter sp.]|nr:hypothetical protein [Candidatus Pelagibacter sp.]MDA9663300.1 hypothetical protein [Candidatus Pelagibacter sp.]